MTRVYGIFLVALLAIWGPTRTSASDHNCVVCDDCAVCARRTPVSTLESLVEIDFSACKDGEKISWGCCRVAITAENVASGCYLDACDAPIENWESPKCNELTRAVYRVQNGTTSLIVQVHDGSFIGDVDCDSRDCCGGSGTSCSSAVSGVCEMTIDLSECPGPFVECNVDSDCNTTTPMEACEKLSCIENVCVRQFKPSTTVCRPNQLGRACDVPENCTGTTSLCPPDLERNKGYSFKCGTDLYLCAMPNTTIVPGNSGTKGSWIRPSYLQQGTNGTCNLGGGVWSIKELSWPHCVTDCIQRTCPNGKDISNYAVSRCNSTTGGWECSYKVDVTTTDLLSRFPFCPYLSLY